MKVTSTDDRVLAALHTVLDPCSVAANSPLSIVDLGLVVETRLENTEEVHVTLRLTGPGCVLGSLIARDAEDAVLAVPGILRARVHIDPDPVWTPELMSAAGKRSLDERRTTGHRLAPVRPQQWKEIPADPG